MREKQRKVKKNYARQSWNVSMRKGFLLMGIDKRKNIRIMGGN
jgi:hypothetical protein